MWTRSSPWPRNSEMEDGKATRKLGDKAAHMDMDKLRSCKTTVMNEGLRKEHPPNLLSKFAQCEDPYLSKHNHSERKEP